MKIKETLQKSMVLVLVMTLLGGVIYPLTITAIAQLLFKDKANGSIIEADGTKYGSELLGQPFSGDQYMWGRVMNRNSTMYGSPSNISTASEEFEKLVEERVNRIRSANPDAVAEDIPVELVTNSGSGMDPHISYNAAKYQLERIANSRNISISRVQEIMDRNTTDRFAKIFGEKVVNVLKVNLELDRITD